MTNPVQLPKYSLGVGDRFAHQARAQLQAFLLAKQEGLEIVPVWNKSNREHAIIGSEPSGTRAAADDAVQSLGWKEPYFVDADHINLKTVDRFLQPCDFFTLDVADRIGQPADRAAVNSFIDRHPELIGTVNIPSIARSFQTDRPFVQGVANQFLAAVQDAGRIYRYLEEKRGKGTFITEVSMDETDAPQTPVELLIILAALADEGIPVQTIAPKFTGRFNKGVDYAGNLAQFREEFSDDLAVIAFAIQQYGLPANLKLSVHSGSDKFSLYEPIRQAMKKHNAGIHLKTAGTTWLEELIGLAESGGPGLALAQEIYAEAYGHREELCGPYATVIDIDPGHLPTPDTLNQWSAEQLVAALRHDPRNPAYNPHMRQLLHVGFKVAAKMGNRYLDLLKAAENTIAKNVTGNLFNRHIKPLFLGN
jgi:hypothetical protein